jgi:chemotaxis signal transduction protein
LRAFHEGGQVNIEVSDDGAGLNGERIRQKAIERGLVTAQQAARMSDRDAYNMIFLPGFSTAEKVTNVSGRGVGMDVVKTNVAKIGGTVDVHSTPGKGTTVKIKIPLTLAIIPALMVTSGGERFAIPQVSLLELVRLDASHASREIETVHGSPVYRLRGRLLPVVYLNRELQLADGAAANASGTNMVVVQADGREFGLVVDEITDTEEIVVKPLGKQLKGVSAYSGATIMGDGRAALILDILGLAQRAQVLSETRDSALSEKAGIKDLGAHREDGAPDRQTVLVWCRLAHRAAWPSHCRWWPGWRSFPRAPSNWRDHKRSPSTAGRSCPSSVCPASSGLAGKRATPRATLGCQSWFIPKLDGALGWWWIGWSTSSMKSWSCRILRSGREFWVPRLFKNASPTCWTCPAWFAAPSPASRNLHTHRRATLWVHQSSFVLFFSMGIFSALPCRKSRKSSSTRP